ncbi:MAG TPA: hypothetical protein VER03_07165 [Bryobacteraceae bacterium]|nr:hypothetical protein [Bryobacteraceae bacterium]
MTALNVVAQTLAGGFSAQLRRGGIALKLRIDAWAMPVTMSHRGPHGNALCHAELEAVSEEDSVGVIQA